MGSHCQEQHCYSKMNFITSLLLLGLFACAFGQDGVPCSEEISAQCPDLDPGNPVFIADPAACNKFCECSGGDAWSQTCAPGLLFDDIELICNWPDNVICGDRPIFTFPPVETTPAVTQ